MQVNKDDGNTTDGCINKNQHIEFIISSHREIVAHTLIAFFTAH